MKKRFEYEFDDESPEAKITLEYALQDDEALRFGSEGEGMFLTANRTGLLCLAKLFTKLALGKYKPGFHLHIGEDFSSGGVGQSLRISIDERETDGM
jgi:hypothetical protein